MAILRPPSCIEPGWRVTCIGQRRARRILTAHLPEGDPPMPVAKVTELSCTSTESFEEAVREGIERAQKTLRGVKSAWVKEQRVNVNREGALEFQANILVTFILED
jgi:flavin-binding protein dodecin